MPRLTAPLPVLAIALAIAAPLASQRTWVLDASGAGDFTTLSNAWASLRDGDRLLVLPGSYVEPGSPVFPGKAVEVLGAAPDRARATITGQVSFRRLGAGRFALSGVTFVGWLDITGHGGLVLLHDLALHGVSLSGCPNVVVQDVSTVAVDRQLGAPGLMVDDSVSINACTLVGAPGHATPRGGIPGGDGLRTAAGYAVADHTCFAGGAYDGAGASFQSTNVPDTGVIAAAECDFASGPTFWRPAAAVRTDLLLTPGFVVHDRCTFQGGLSTVVTAPRSMPALAGPANAARGGTATWTASGADGGAVLLLFAFDVAPQSHPMLGTPFWLLQPSAPVALTIAGGNASFTLSVPKLPALADLFVFAQAVGWLGDAQWRPTSVVATRIR